MGSVIKSYILTWKSAKDLYPPDPDSPRAKLELYADWQDIEATIGGPVDIRDLTPEENVVIYESSLFDKMYVLVSRDVSKMLLGEEVGGGSYTITLNRRIFVDLDSIIDRAAIRVESIRPKEVALRNTEIIALLGTELLWKYQR